MTVDDEPRYWVLPTDRLRVPAQIFAAVLAAVAARYAARPDDRYAAGALHTAQWIAGLTDRHPLRDVVEPCTTEGMASCQIAADAIAYRLPHAQRGIHQDWALGVAGMVAWARGASRRPPVPVPPATA